MPKAMNHLGIHQVIALNERGVELIHCGSYDAASHVFKSALQSVKSLVKTNKEGQIKLEETLSICQAPQAGERCWSNDGLFMLYTAPVRLNAAAISMSIPSFSLHRILSSALIFNIALASHLKLVLVRNFQTGVALPYDDIVRLYKYAYVLLMESQPGIDEGAKLSYQNYLALAILNNLAHIHYILRQDRLVDMMCSTIGKVLFPAVQDGNNNTAHEGFIVNVIHFMFNFSQAAPAA